MQNPVIPPSFDHYRVSTKPDGSLWILGRGGMGITYRAIDTKLGREVALKVIDSNRLMDEAARHRFLREAKANAMLHHRNLAAVCHQGQVGDSCYYAMELIDGKTLQEVLKERGALPALEALEIIRQAAQALSEAERHGLVHRDIKPANLMVKFESDGAMLVKLIDFGLVKAIVPDDHDATQITVDGGYLGTAMTSSPEQCRGDDLDSRSDIYGLGIVLWNMIEGRPPFEDPNHFRLMMAHLETPLPLERLAGHPGPLVDLIARMLAKNREDRPANTTALLELIASARAAVENPETAPAAEFLDPAHAPEPLPAPPAPEPEEAVEASRGFPYGTAAALVLAFTAAFVAWRLKQHRDARAAAPATAPAPAHTPGEGGGSLLGLSRVEETARASDWPAAVAAAVELMGRATTEGRRREVETSIESLSTRLLAQPDVAWTETLRASASAWRAWNGTGPHPAAKLALLRALRATDPSASADLLAQVDPASLTDVHLRLEHEAARLLTAPDAETKAAAEAGLARILNDLDRLGPDSIRRGAPALRALATAGHVPVLLLLAREATDPAEAQTLRMEAAQRLDREGQWAQALAVYLELLRGTPDPTLTPLVRERIDLLARGFLEQPARLPDSAFLAARPLFEEAGQAGVAAAAELVAVRTLAAEPATALPWFVRAAKGGSAGAMLQLSLLHDQGNGTPVNREEARAWLEKAAAAGHPGGQVLLAQRLQANGDEPSLAAAAGWLEKAAASQFPPALESLADTLRRGRGVTADPARARELYRRAADAGQLRAMGSLGTLLLNGEGGEPDPTRGLALLEEGANRGDGWCQYLLGSALWKGQGIAQDRPRATLLLKEAARGGITEARRFCEQSGIPLL